MGDRGDKPGYEKMDIGDTGEGAVERAFANQVDYCEANGALVTARVVRGIAAVLESDTATALVERIRRWQGAPLADALPLRVAGGIHALHLSGTEDRLAPIYADLYADDVAVLREVIETREAELLPWLDSPPQTNEAGRSANFVAAMLWLAGRGLPPVFDCLEIGASAGINLMLERYGYDLGGVTVGPANAAMNFTPAWTGPPPPGRDIAFASLEGCDVAPVDLTDPVQAMRLRAYIWPEHTVRFERMDTAIAAACERAPQIARMNAADFVESRLARPQAAGTTRVLMHSVVWQYVPQDQQARVIAAMEAAGAQHATADRPLAWVRVEANRTVHRHELTVRYWPGGADEVLLARSHAHGAAIDWVAPE